MSLWEQHNMEQRVRAALGAVHLQNPEGHHLGRPYLSAYQIAIAVDAADPGLKDLIGKPVGGAGAGSHNSLAQYIANELSKQIKALGAEHFVEGAFISNEHVRAIVYEGSDGGELVSSLTGTDFDMAVFRLRAAE